MDRHLYLSLIPESLIASMLPPVDFGNYYAIGAQAKSRGQAVFFEVDPDFESDYFDLSQIEKRCLPHPDGRPRKSTYLSIYRVLEHVPISALGKLYLTTDDGRVLGLEARQWQPDTSGGVHLYQEYCPVGPRVASNLPPERFIQRVTDPGQPISVPKIVFAELILDGLSTDPRHAPADNLPYPNIAHLRDCLIEQMEDADKPTKLVTRAIRGDILYRTIRNGFFIGAGSEFKYYPMPDRLELENQYYDWWRSALTTFGQ